MRRLRLPLAVIGLIGAAFAPSASAHPLGNFSINHLTQVRISADRVDVRYVLDQAEIPTFQERGLAPAVVLDRKKAEVARALELEVDGRRRALRPAGVGVVSFPPGQGGLKLTRVELALTADVRAPRRIVLRDRTFPDRVGWKAIQILPGKGTAVRADVYAQDPTNGLRRYPKDTLASPLDQRTATFEVATGTGTLRAPAPPAGYRATTADRAGDGFAGVFDDAGSGDGVLILLLLVAFGWGALHALSPGHGKAMVAAYLIGTRGSARHALGLGAIVTFTHTIGVFMLGFVTLALSQYILPEDLYPWLNMVAGLLVVTVGLGVLRARLRHARAHHSHSGHHHHDHPHDVPDRVTWRGLAGMGAAAGLIPCPSALVVLLGAIAQHQIGLGLVLILAFSLGLAATLTGLGLAVVYARRALTRVRVPSRLASALPAASAVVIVCVGLVLTARAVPSL